MGNPRLYYWRKWERRAETLLRNAQDLFVDTVDVCGVDDPITDMTDGAVCALENMVAAIHDQIAVIKAR